MSTLDKLRLVLRLADAGKPLSRDDIRELRAEFDAIGELAEKLRDAYSPGGTGTVDLEASIGLARLALLNGHKLDEAGMRTLAVTVIALADLCKGDRRRKA